MILKDLIDVVLRKLLAILLQFTICQISGVTSYYMEVILIWALLFLTTLTTIGNQDQLVNFLIAQRNDTRSHDNHMMWLLTWNCQLASDLLKCYYQSKSYPVSSEPVHREYGLFWQNMQCATTVISVIGQPWRDTKWTLKLACFIMVTLVLWFISEFIVYLHLI